MNKNNYINLAKKAANTQIQELKKINSVFNSSFICKLAALFAKLI